MLDYLVFIGRMSPPHLGHAHVIETALKQSKNVIVLVGSASSARTTRNPFTFDERKRMILDTFKDERVSVLPIDDYPYNDTQWVADVQKTVFDYVLSTWRTEYNPSTFEHNVPSIGLIGYCKDHTSYYQKLFPKWKSVNVEAQFSTLNSSDIRREYLKDFYRLPDTSHCPKAVVEFMTDFVKTPDFQRLVAENKFNTTYDPRKYDNDIVACVDAVVIQSGHILLIRRKDYPGKGLLALPGGHVNKTEKFLDAAIRELKEETRISDGKGEIPPAMLKSFITKKDFFDDPHRSLRARVTSMAYLFELPPRQKLFKVRGDDDAESAQWFPIGELNQQDFFEDHYAILNAMINK